ncbi:MAG: NAD(P)-dependent oxidoreductase [Deltaproteobacteria bacterium]|nr:NAD(P)-dependent oxidoreductase [Deltaproteobacteria bacterium]
MSTFLVTGGSGFFGGILQRKLLDAGHRVVNIDLQPDEQTHERLTSIRGDIRDVKLLEKLAAEHRFDAIFHCAAVLAHAVKDENFLWTSNVDGTRNVAALAKSAKIPKLVSISSNCLWAQNHGRPVTEDDAPAPVEIYGRSKWEGEKILREFTGDTDVTVIRTPTIIEAGRLGLLAILFEFIDEGRKVWVVGGGKNVYQWCAAGDLAEACTLALGKSGSHVFNVGSDDVKSMADVYRSVIARAQTGARVASLPRGPAILGMKLAYALKMSPLGPYQYRMIAEDFVFDTSRIKAALGWRPTLTNEDMLLRAYEYYRKNRAEIEGRTDVSAHRQAASMGVIRLLKWLS